MFNALMVDILNGDIQNHCQQASNHVFCVFVYSFYVICLDVNYHNSTI